MKNIVYNKSYPVCQIFVTHSVVRGLQYLVRAIENAPTPTYTCQTREYSDTKRVYVIECNDSTRDQSVKVPTETGRK